MQIVKSIDDIKKDLNSAVTVGAFDGLHKAHQSIIRMSSEVASATSGRNIVITFDPHPRMVIDGLRSPKLLSTTEEKIDLIRKLKLPVDILFIIPFTREFSRLNSQEFFEGILFDKIGFNNLVIGYDHFFGKDREGNVHFLENMKTRIPFGLSVVDKITINNEPVNSTHIRRLILNGEIKRANQLLGWNYLLTGIIVEGNKRGRTIGFPTANLKPLCSDKLIPKNGVYFVKVYLDDDSYYGFLNIGIRPTFENDSEVFIETHIFDFEGDIYNKKMTIEFYDFIRDEKKFNSPEELIDQINKDKQICLQFLNNK